MSLKQGCPEEESDTISRRRSAFTGRASTGRKKVREERGEGSEDTEVEKCKKKVTIT